MLTFLKIFDNPLKKSFFQKNFLHAMAVLGYLPNNLLPITSLPYFLLKTSNEMCY